MRHWRVNKSSEYREGELDMETKNTSCFINSNIIGNRRVVIWGAGKRGEQICSILKRYCIEIDCFVDSNTELFAEKSITNLKVNHFTYLSGQNKEYFVVVAIDRFYSEINDFLCEEGYTETEDFFWYKRTAIIPELINNCYKDDFGNEVYIEDTADMDGFSIRIYGEKNSLRVRNMHCLGQIIIQLKNSAKMHITNAMFFGECDLNSNNGQIILSDETQLKNTKLNVETNAVIICKGARLIDLKAETSYDSKFLCENSDISGIIRTAMKSIVELRATHMKKNAQIIAHGYANLIVLNALLDENFLLRISNTSSCELKHVGLGKKSNIYIEKNSNVRLTTLFLFENSRINCEDHSQLEVSECKLEGSFNILTRYKSEVKIEKATTYGDGEISCECNAFITIEAGCFFHKDLFMRADHESSIIIRKNCGVSKHVFIMSGDSHPIYCVGSPQRYFAKSKTEIGEKVWIGYGAVILENTTVGSGSVISPHSVLGGNYPNNCMLMGYPARIVRQDIIWDRTETDPDKIQDKSYWQYTSHGKQGGFHEIP